MSVKTLLTKEIESQIETLDELEFGSDAYKNAIDGLAKLLDKHNEMEKTEFEYQDRYESRVQEADLKREEMEEERKDHFIKNVLTGVSAIGGFALTIWGTRKSIEFEKTGTFTTIMGRGFIQKLLPKK